MKVLFFDIDGTLAIRKKIVPSALEALKKLKEKGYGVNMKKYLSIKVRPDRKAIRT